MKKNIFTLFAAAALLAFGMTSCEKEDNNNSVVNPTNENARVKSAADLIGTEWEYTLSLGTIDTAELIAMGYDTADLADFADMLTMTFGLNFDADYAHLTFPEDVIGLNVVEVDDENYTIEEITQMDYTYTYDPATHTGTLTGGNLADLVLDFTYDVTTDGIIFNMFFADEGNEANAVPFQLVFSRVE